MVVESRNGRWEVVSSVVVVEVVTGFFSSMTVVQAVVARIIVMARARMVSLVFIRIWFAARCCGACMNIGAVR